MNDKTSRPERPIPTTITSGQGQKAEGYLTPRQDKILQCARFAPSRVLPIVFLPGIMGSNLKITSAERISMLKQKDNIAWRPDEAPSNLVKETNRPADQRQLRLDPATTDVDRYDPNGKPDIDGDGRHSKVKLGKDFDSAILYDDPPTQDPKTARTAVQKARERGWGEVYFSSYGPLLQTLETRMNNLFVDGALRAEWRDVVGTDPKHWGSVEKLPQKPLTEDDLKQTTVGCCFPVHAIGYNWLKSSALNAADVAKRIETLIANYKKAKFECEKVILVTHSMGGLLARAVVHPKYGNLEDKVLGIVHGVQPAIGAAAAYKRMRAGFEDDGLVKGVGKSAWNRSTDGIEGSVSAKMLGNYGDEVTAVLGNAPGGLELLPSSRYGNGWLKIQHDGRQLEALPRNGDPYEEIYKTKGKWYSLLREDWINPSKLLLEKGGGSLERSFEHLDKAKKFHDAIAGYYHSQTYVHYGADKGRIAFGDVVWNIGTNCVDSTEWQNWPILADTRQGAVELVRWYPRSNDKAFGISAGPSVTPRPISASIGAPSEAGDQTVPMRSADDQLKSGMCKAVFRQTGYEHQSSYKDPNALASTLYSIVRIAQQAKWKHS